MANDQEATPQSRKLTKGPSGHYAEHLSTHVRDPKDCPTCKCIEAQMDEATPQSVEPRIEPWMREAGEVINKRYVQLVRDAIAKNGGWITQVIEDPPVDANARIIAAAYRAESRAPQTPQTCKDCEANDRDFRTIAEELALTEHTREAIVKRIRELMYRLVVHQNAAGEPAPPVQACPDCLGGSCRKHSAGAVQSQDERGRL